MSSYIVTQRLYTAWVSRHTLSRVSVAQFWTGSGTRALPWVISPLMDVWAWLPGDTTDPAALWAVSLDLRYKQAVKGWATLVVIRSHRCASTYARETVVFGDGCS